MIQFLKDVETAKNIVSEATGIELSDKYAIKEGHLSGMLGKLVLSTKTIIVDTATCKKYNIDVLPVVIHELLHAINLEEFPCLTPDDSKLLRDAIGSIDESSIKKYAVKLYAFLAKDGRNSKYDESIVEDLLAEGDKILSGLETKIVFTEFSQRPKFFIKVYNNLYDKIENTLRYNACGGHTDEWLDLKDAVESEFDVEIPVKM